MYKIVRVPHREKRYFKEITGMLVIKLCLIIGIRIIFFSPPQNGPDDVNLTAAHLLGVSVPISVPDPRPPSSDSRSNHDQ